MAEARNIGALDMSEMLSACSLLESRGAIRIATGSGGGAGGGRARKLRLLWDEADLVAALRDKPLLSAILSDLSSLPSAHWHTSTHHSFTPLQCRYKTELLYKCYIIRNTDMFDKLFHFSYKCLYAFKVMTCGFFLATSRIFCL